MVNAPDPILATDLAGAALRSPVMLAAGTAGTLDETADLLRLDRIGGLVTKSITREAREGNPTWRILPAGAGMLNAIGLANVGVEAFCREEGPRVASVPASVFASVAGHAVDDYVFVAERLARIEGLAGIELNVSCPNVHGGTEFGVDREALAELVGRVRAAVGPTRLFVKLSPVAVGRPGIVDLARAAIDPPGSSPCAGARPGADAIVLANTTPAMAIDVRTRRPALANGTGGLSGPAVHAVVVKLIHDAYRGVCREAGVPIVGLGGVLRWQDAAEFVLAGASAAQVGTLLFVRPRAVYRVQRGLAKWARAQGVSNLSELVGRVDLSPRGPTA